MAIDTDMRSGPPAFDIRSLLTVAAVLCVIYLGAWGYYEAAQWLL